MSSGYSAVEWNVYFGHICDLFISISSITLNRICANRSLLRWLTAVTTFWASQHPKQFWVVVEFFVRTSWCVRGPFCVLSSQGLMPHFLWSVRSCWGNWVKSFQPLFNPQTSFCVNCKCVCDTCQYYHEPQLMLVTDMPVGVICWSPGFSHQSSEWWTESIQWAAGRLGDERGQRSLKGCRGSDNYRVEKRSSSDSQQQNSRFHFWQQSSGTWGCNKKRLFDGLVKRRRLTTHSHR